jgi:radical SAM superfamily enzyme YgiQ (UPF0313 family)
MKKILLVKPPFKALTYPGNPKGPDLLKASVKEKERDLDVRICDLQLASHRKQDVGEIFVDELKSFKPDMIGITNLSVQVNHANRLAEIAKETDPSVVIVKGGYHESSSANWTMELHGDVIDFCIGSDGCCTARVEGENAFREIGSLLAKGGKENLLGNLDNVPGAVYYGGNVLRMNKPAITSREMLNEFFAVDFDHSPEYNFPVFEKMPTAHAELGRGCPMKCNFCAGARTKPLRLRNLQSIRRQLGMLKRKGFEAFYADDSTLTVNCDWAMNVAKILFSQGFIWGGNTRVDQLDRETVMCFGRTGCRYLFTGLESGVKEVLLGMNKVWTEKMADVYLAKAERVYQWLAEAGIPSAAFLMFGGVKKQGNVYVPETFQDVKESIRFATNLEQVSYISMNFLRFLPGTNFAEDPAFASIRPTGERPLHGGYWDDKYYEATGESDIRQKWNESEIYSCFELEDEMPVSTLLNQEYATEIVLFAISEIEKVNRKRGKNEPGLQIASAGEKGKEFIDKLTGT